MQRLMNANVLEEFPVGMAITGLVLEEGITMAVMQAMNFVDTNPATMEHTFQLHKQLQLHLAMASPQAGQAVLEIHWYLTATSRPLIVQSINLIVATDSATG